MQISHAEGAVATKTNSGTDEVSSATDNNVGSGADARSAEGNTVRRVGP